MSFDLEKEITNLEEEINEDEMQLNNINKLYNKIPKDIYFKNKKNEKNINKFSIKSFRKIKFNNILISIRNNIEFIFKKIYNKSINIKRNIKINRGKFIKYKISNISRQNFNDNF